MKAIGIDKPCSENWNAMTPTEQGKFCQKCATQVYDFTNKSNVEIKQTLRTLIGQSVCGRITPAQEDSLNAEFIAWSSHSTRSIQNRMLFSLVVVFGLTLFSCSHEQDKEKIVAVQTSAMNAMKDQSLGVFQEEDRMVEALKPLNSISVDSMEYLGGIVLVKQMELQEFVPIPLMENEYYYSTGGTFMSTPSYDNYLLQDYPGIFTQDISGIIAQELDENGIPIPTDFAALVYPNPVSTVTTFEFSLPEKTKVEIGLYDMNGKFIQAVHQGKIDRGTFKQDIDMTNYTPGIYLIIINSKNYQETVRISKI